MKDDDGEYDFYGHETYILEELLTSRADTFVKVVYWKDNYKQRILDLAKEINNQVCKDIVQRIEHPDYMDEYFIVNYYN